MRCVRCSAELEAGTYAGREVHACPACRGVLLGQRDLTAVLETLAAAMAGHLSADTPVEAVEDEGRDAACPRCGAAMETHGYMGSRTVRIDSCFACRLLWADPFELGAMALLYARTRLRSEQRARSSAGVRADVTTAHQVGQVAAQAFLLGFLARRIRF